MYFWNIKALKSDLKKKKFSETNAFAYALAGTILISLALVLSLIQIPNQYDIYDSINQAIIAIIGLIYLFKCNGGAKGKNFLSNYISISWVCTIRFLVMIFIPAIIVFYSLSTYFLGGSDETTIDVVIFYAIMSILFYVYAGKHIKDVNKK